MVNETTEQPAAPQTEGYTVSEIDAPWLITGRNPDGSPKGGAKIKRYECAFCAFDSTVLDHPVQSSILGHLRAAVHVWGKDPKGGKV